MGEGKEKKEKGTRGMILGVQGGPAFLQGPSEAGTALIFWSYRTLLVPQHSNLYVHRAWAKAAELYVGRNRLQAF